MRLTSRRTGSRRMTGLRAAVATEFLKSRRSRVPWGVAIGFSIAPLVMGLFMVILKDPERGPGAGPAWGQGTTDRRDRRLADLLVAPRPGRHRRRADPVRVPDRLGLWSRVRRPDRPRVARDRHAAAHDRHRQGPDHRVWGTAISGWILLLSLGIGGLIGLPGWSASAATQALATIGFAPRS